MATNFSTNLTTSTRIRVPAGALRWLEVFWGYLGDVVRQAPDAPVIKAAAQDYQEQFSRDLYRDLGLKKDRKQ